ncbi:MAG: transcription-repair coupling factor, partial [Exilispira sp.]
MHKIYQIFSNIFDEKVQIRNFLNKKVKDITFINTTLSAFMSLFIYISQRTKQSLLIILPDEDIVDKFYSVLNEEFLDIGKKISIFAPYNLFFYECNPSDKKNSFFRVEAIDNLRYKKGIVLTTPLALLYPTISLENLVEKKIILRKNEVINPEILTQSLIEAGFERVDQLFDFGTFTWKGNIIDCFYNPSNNPVRIVLNEEDRIEKITFIEQETFRILKEIEKIEILPIKEFFIEDDLKDKFVEEFYRLNSLDLDAESYVKDLQTEQLYAVLWALPELILNKKYIFSHLDNDDIIGIFNFEQIEKKILEEYKKSERAYKNLELKGLCKPDEIFIDLSEFNRFLRYFKKFIINSKIYDEKSESINLFTLKVEPYQNKFEEFRIIFKSRIMQGAKLYFIAKEDEKKRLSILFKDLKANYIDDNLIEGFFFEDKNEYYYSVDELIEYKIRSKASKSFQVEFVESTLDIKSGEYLVHINHGIGIYEGLKRVTILNQEKDYLEIRYKNNEKVYVPVENIGLVQKYISFGKTKPELDNISSRTWKKTLAKTKQQIMEYATQLLLLYQKRKEQKGISFKPFNELEKELADSFEYKETYDQQRAIEDVLFDMQQTYPMDRLICGDVGFGKTEIAIRATYRAVLNGYQVAVICPTTILADQHYETFKKRLDRFGLKIGLLSRLVDLETQKDYCKKIEQGNLDVIIGTHRILSNDIKFKKLGLLIIDEEHKFGVEHKDKFIRLKSDIDVLSLSATPIPRSLHMALSRIRPLSIINTAPEQRVPVEVFVEPFNDYIVKSAIERELERDGQVFYVHNRVKTILNVVLYLKNMFKGSIPIVYAHGQMSEHELESNITKFIKKEARILVSTSIIESGIDIPDVNTIIIDNAHLFGLSSLYQLKGRVGRRSRKAYAYLLYPKENYLNEIALKRLQVISDYAELGSGYKVALKDLELRGAGNILGKEQSGFIMNVGYYLYEKLLDEAITKLENRGKKRRTKAEIELQLKTSLPDFMGFSKQEKINFYEQLLDCDTEEEFMQFKYRYKNIIDNAFYELNNLLLITRIRILAQKKGITRILELKDSIAIFFENPKINMEIFLNYVKKKEVTFNQQINDRIDIIKKFKNIDDEEN